MAGNFASSDTLAHWAETVLRISDPWQKAHQSRAFAQKWQEGRARGQEMAIGAGNPPDRPARPEAPALLHPREVPKRKPGSEKGRAALLHAIAHIELNAIDLHWDIIARFTDTHFPIGFYDDWVKAADEESKHFLLISQCLNRYDTPYGALPAHAGMWRAAEDTAQDILGRLAVVPMVLEARGLDVTPNMIKIFKNAQDTESVAALEVIYAEEVAHVAYGSKWFHFLCGRFDQDPKQVFHDLVRRYFRGPLKPPFNEEKRAEAGIAPDFYWPLAEDIDLPVAL